MHFHTYKGIIKKVEQVQFFRKLSPLGNAVLFKKKKKKIALEVNRGRQVCVRARAPRYGRSHLHFSYEKYAS